MFQHSASYPVVAKSLRDIFIKKTGAPVQKQHCCGMMSMAEQGVGYDDLNELMKKPQPLTFTLGKFLISLSLTKSNLGISSLEVIR